MVIRNSCPTDLLFSLSTTLVAAWTVEKSFGLVRPAVKIVGFASAGGRMRDIAETINNNMSRDVRQILCFVKIFSLQVNV